MSSFLYVFESYIILAHNFSHLELNLKSISETAYLRQVRLYLVRGACASVGEKERERGRGRRRRERKERRRGRKDVASELMP